MIEYFNEELEKRNLILNIKSEHIKWYKPRRKSGYSEWKGEGVDI